MTTIILFRGLPGAGKTTAGRLLCRTVLSADDYHLTHRGYEFDKTNLAEAHRQCLSNVESAIRLGIEVIGVANTFTQEWEMAPYYKLAQQYHCMIFSLVVENRHGGGSGHVIPEDVIARMQDRFEVKL